MAKGAGNASPPATGLRLIVTMGEEFDPPFRISLLLQTMGFCGQGSPSRRWIRMANRRFSQGLEVVLSTPLLRPARAFDITIIFPAESCTVRSFNFFHTATFRHRLALT